MKLLKFIWTVIYFHPHAPFLSSFDFCPFCIFSYLSFSNKINIILFQTSNIPSRSHGFRLTFHKVFFHCPLNFHSFSFVFVQKNKAVHLDRRRVYHSSKFNNLSCFTPLSSPPDIFPLSFSLKKLTQTSAVLGCCPMANKLSCLRLFLFHTLSCRMSLWQWPWTQNPVYFLTRK